MMCPGLRGSYESLKRWYCHTSTRAPNPTREDMVKVTGDYTARYWRKEPTPPRIPVSNHVKPFVVNNDVPSKGVGGERGSGVMDPTSQIRR